MTFLQTIALAALAWAAFSHARGLRALHQKIEDQENWIREIGQEVQRLPERLRDSEAVSQFIELLKARRGE